jgi:signal transduction histidine kinase
MEPTHKKSLASDGIRATSKRISVFISDNVESIVEEWESFAKTLTPSSEGMTPLALRDHIHQILSFITEDIKSSQTPKEQTVKSKGAKKGSSSNTAAETHAALRLSGGFNIGQMVSEYRSLRAIVIKLWSRTDPPMDKEYVEDLTRFNEAIDQALAESVSYYTKEIIRSKDIFVGILGHDIRSPLQSIVLSTQLLMHSGNFTERQRIISKGTLESAERITGLIDTLLDVTRARLGGGIRIIRSPMDLSFVARQIVDEIRVVHPTRIVNLDIPEELRCEWDKARIGQVLSNLLSNAVQYSFKDTPIWISIRDDSDLVVLTVGNNGLPIASSKINTLFDPLTRGSEEDSDQPTSANLGLGLFITREIVQGHGGKISVFSSEIKGTTFTVEIPRQNLKVDLHIV